MALACLAPFASVAGHLIGIRARKDLGVEESRQETEFRMHLRGPVPSQTEALTRPAESLLGEPGPLQSQPANPTSESPADIHAQPMQRGLLVEFVRLIMVSLFALAGWEIAQSSGPDRHTGILLGILLGSGIGYVLGGVFGRKTASAVSDFEREFRRIPAPELLAGGIGLLLGVALAALLSVPLFHLPAGASYATVAFVYITIGYGGYRIGRAKTDELFGLFGVKTRAAGIRRGEVSVVDSSAILDGRILPLVRMGFLGGTLLVTRSVLDELQLVADSSDSARRARGRGALDVLVALKRDPSVDVILVDDEPGTAADPVDGRLVRMARARGGALVTNDAALARVASALDVPVRSINALADALKPQVVPGERVPLRLVRRGRESGQAVGYLDDGTMVVVEEADHLLGDTVKIAVTNALLTSSGRMIFARVAEEQES